MASVTLPGALVTLTAETADKLLALDQGDSALLYIALLRHGGELIPARQALGWSQGRLDTAYAALQRVQLVGPAPVKADEPQASQPPEYMTQDVVNALEEDEDFAGLLRQVERELGVKLSPTDLKTLYTVYDYLSLPPEVILLLTSWCVEETERKYGPGRRPRMSAVRKEAFRWHDRGLDSLLAAEDYLKSQKDLSQRERAILPLVGVQGRAPTSGEREFIATWVDWGFPDESIALAYERTVMKKQSMSWPYMNSILRNWHAKGLHTPQEIQRGDAGSRPAGRPAGEGAAKTQSQRQDRMARNIAALKRSAGKKPE